MGTVLPAYTGDFATRNAMGETRSEAWSLGDGSPVVLLVGKVGGYALERVRLRGAPA